MEFVTWCVCYKTEHLLPFYVPFYFANGLYVIIVYLVIDGTNIECVGTALGP
jgi:hypothetical protein